MRVTRVAMAGAIAVVAGAWGLLLLTTPANSTSGLARLIGIGLVLLGASFLVRSTWSGRPRFDWIDAATWALVGLIAIVWPNPTVRGLVWLVGVALVVTGLVELLSALTGDHSDRLVLGLGGVSSVGLGVAALAWPSATTLVLSILVGARLIIAAAGLVGRVFSQGEAGSGSRLRTGVRLTASIAGVLVATVAAVVAVAVARAQPESPDVFYDAPDPLPGGPGTMIRSEVVDPFIAGATAYRVLYVTSNHDGTPTTSSGLVIVPDGEAPEGGRPVMAFTHGTIGIASRCSPSLLPGEVYGPLLPGLADYLEAGFVVAATDYAGLGSDAVTGYLVGAGQAYSTLDSVRAAVAMPETGAVPRFVVFGESQGGHAALFTGQYLAEYAPELELAGVAAAAPATDLRSLFEENMGSTFGDVLASFALVSWRDTYGIDLLDIAHPEAVPVIERVGELCLQTERQLLAVVPEAELLKVRFLEAPPWETEPWATIIATNTPGGSPVDAPVLIAQGADDPLVLPAVQQSFVDAWCDTGQSIEYRVYEGVGHLDSGRATATDVTEWARARLAGEPWSSTCGLRLAVLPSRQGSTMDGETSR